MAFLGKRLLTTTGVLSLVFVMALGLVPSHSSAVDSSLWLTAPLASDIIGSGVAIPYSIGGNRPCTQRNITDRARVLVVPAASHETCVVNANYGGVSQSGLLQVQGSDIFGELLSADGRRMNMIPIPNSDTVITLEEGAQIGTYINFIRNFAETISSEAYSTGIVAHTLKPDATKIPLKDKAGKLLPIDYDSISFSADGRFMVASIPFIGVVRINIATLEIMPFGGAFNYNVGLAPTAQTAITSNGRYAVVASGTFNVFKLYDIETCGAAPQELPGPMNCQVRDLLPFMQLKTPGLAFYGVVRFMGDDAISLYSSDVDSTGKRTIRQQFVYAGNKPQSELQYLALGDSFASGEGVYNYNSATDTALNDCHLSLRSYPYLIAASLGLNQQQSVACSGAKINDIMNDLDDYKGQTKDKINQQSRIKKPILDGFLPGYLNQLTFVDNKKPDVITISTVGNDVGFSDKITRCIGADTCYSSYEDRLEALNEINGQFYPTRDMYASLKQASGPYTKIYAVGYPQIADAEGSCGVNVHLNRAEILFANQLVNFLNDMIRGAADNAGVAYVDVGHALDGHRLCETVYSNIAVNGLTAGKDRVDLPLIHGPIGNESYHPNALGHRLLSQVILAGTNNLTRTMPAPNSAIGPAVISSNLEILQAVKKNRPIYKATPQSMTSSQLVKNRAENTVIQNMFAPNSPVDFALHSEPVSLGTKTTSNNGSLQTSITIPASVPTGFHTLHAFGKNSSGEAIDVYQVVYVAESTEDLNGNGVLDEDDPCTVVEALNIDTDGDGIDDACDPLIDEPPITVMPPDPTLPIEQEPESAPPHEPVTEEPPLVVNPPQSEPEIVTAPLDSTPQLETAPDTPPPTIPLVIDFITPIPEQGEAQTPQPETANPQGSDKPDKPQPLHESNPWANYSPTTIVPTATSALQASAAVTVRPAAATTPGLEQPEASSAATSEAVLGAESLHATFAVVSEPSINTAVKAEQSIVNSTTVVEIIAGCVALLALILLVAYRVNRQKTPY